MYVKLADGGVMGIISAWQSVPRRTKEDNGRRLALEALGFRVSRLVHQYVLAVWPQLKKDGLQATVQQPPATLSVGLSAAQVFTVLKGMGQNLAPFAKVGPDTKLAIASAGVSASGSGAMIFSKVPEGVRVSLDEYSSREGFVLMSDDETPEGDYLGLLRIAGSGTLNGKQFQVTVGSQSALLTFPSEPPLVPPLAIGLFGGKNPGAGAASVSASAVGSIGVTCAAGLCVGQWSSYQADGGPRRHERPPLDEKVRKRLKCLGDAEDRWEAAVKTCREGSEAAGCIADAGTLLAYGLSACPELPYEVNHPCDMLGDVARTLAWELQRGCSEPKNPVVGQRDNCPNMAQKLADLIAGKARCDSRPCQEAAAAAADILDPIINRCSSPDHVCISTNTDWLQRVKLLNPNCDEPAKPVIE